MTAAIFGLIGVAIGGALQFIREHLILGGQRRREVLAASRLIYADLNLIQLYASARLSDRRDNPERIQKLRLWRLHHRFNPAWETHRAVLAASMSDVTWGYVSVLYMLIAAESIDRTEAPRPNEYLGPKVTWASIDKHAAKARDRMGQQIATLTTGWPGRLLDRLHLRDGPPPIEWDAGDSWADIETP